MMGLNDFKYALFVLFNDGAVAADGISALRALLVRGVTSDAFEPERGVALGVVSCDFSSSSSLTLVNGAGAIDGELFWSALPRLDLFAILLLSIA
jgi:hypothetical protein